MAKRRYLLTTLSKSKLTEAFKALIQLEEALLGLKIVLEGVEKPRPRRRPPKEG